MATLEELQAEVAELKESLEAQITSNKALGADLKKAKADLRKGQEIDPAEFAALQTENETLKGNLAKATKDLTTITGERDKAVKTLETETTITIGMQRDRDLTEALAAINVTNPINLKAAKAMLAAQVNIVTEGDKRVAKVGDKLLTDHLKEWSATDEGKHFVSADNSSGGGAQGGGSQGNSKTMTRAQFDAADQSTRASFAKEGGKVVD
jgi:regulator of replication initiation timing